MMVKTSWSRNRMPNPCILDSIAPTHQLRETATVYCSHAHTRAPCPTNWNARVAPAIKCAPTYSNTQQLRIWDNLKCKLTWEQNKRCYRLFFACVGHSMDIWIDLKRFLSVRKGDGFFSVIFRGNRTETYFPSKSVRKRFFRIFFRETGRKRLSFSVDFGAGNVFSAEFDAENEFSVFILEKRGGTKLCVPQSFRIL